MKRGKKIVRVTGKPKTLDQFLKCYTSEDNESFEDIIIENEKKQRAKVLTERAEYYFLCTIILKIFHLFIYCLVVPMAL